MWKDTCFIYTFSTLLSTRQFLFLKIKIYLFPIKHNIFTNFKEAFFLIHIFTQPTASSSVII